jgi:hypothetical protein
LSVNRNIAGELCERIDLHGPFRPEYGEVNA